MCGGVDRNVRNRDIWQRRPRVDAIARLNHDVGRRKHLNAKFTVLQNNVISRPIGRGRNDACGAVKALKHLGVSCRATRNAGRKSPGVSNSDVQFVP